MTVLFSLDKKGEVFLKEGFHELKILPPVDKDEAV